MYGPKKQANTQKEVAILVHYNVVSAPCEQRKQVRLDQNYSSGEWFQYV